MILIPRMWLANCKHYKSIDSPIDRWGWCLEQPLASRRYQHPIRRQKIASRTRCFLKIIKILHNQHVIMCCWPGAMSKPAAALMKNAFNRLIQFCYLNCIDQSEFQLASWLLLKRPYNQFLFRKWNVCLKTRMIFYARLSRFACTRTLDN